MFKVVDEFNNHVTDILVESLCDADLMVNPPWYAPLYTIVPD